MAKLWRSWKMTKFDLDVVFVFCVGMGQKFGDFGKSRKVATGLLVAADSVVCTNQMRINEMTTKGIWALRRKSMRRRV